jgi:mono/diheme cytochrome c family protein
MTNRLAFFISALALILAVAGAPVWAADAAAGKTVYTSKCQTCHAADGSGNQNLAKAMNVTLRPLSGAEVQGMSDDELKKVITGGKGKMKPIAGLSGADAENVVAYIRTLKK